LWMECLKNNKKKKRIFLKILFLLTRAVSMILLNEHDK